MAYEVSGSGQPLVLLPGGLTGWISWIPHAEALAGSWKVIRLQLNSVALGLTGALLPPEYSTEYEVTSLHKILDALAIEGADFAGWSYGAQIALSFAIHNPDRVRSLTLVEPDAYWILRKRGLLPQHVLDEQRHFQTLAKDDISEAELIAFLHFIGVPADVDPRTLSQWPIWMEHRQSLRIGNAPFQHDDSIELVRAFEKPVLLVKGEGSNPDLHSGIDVLAEELPDARVITLPGGHSPHIVSMETFLARLTGFLSERNGEQ
ncbi:MAG: alpha/beta hydrolase [Anaerolineae bacterium]|jgi:pimeloyl-ACP methyl ester carboxylesterase